VCATGREYLDEPALAVMCCAFDESAFRVLPGLMSPRDVAQARMDWGNHSASFAVLHGDPANRSLTRLLRELAARTDTGFVVGGLTSSRGRSVQYADGVVEGALSGVLFSEEIVVATRLTQGCSPIGPLHRITECRHNVLIRLDGRPALDVLREDAGPEVSANFAAAGGYLFAGLPVDGSDTGAAGDVRARSRDLDVAHAIHRSARRGNVSAEKLDGIPGNTEIDDLVTPIVPGQEHDVGSDGCSRQCAEGHGGETVRA
jgi:small ligand-binding sensory domain FIST